jgi:hypothetical protein
MEKPRGNPREMALISKVNIDVNVNEEQGLAMTILTSKRIW